MHRNNKDSKNMVHVIASSYQKKTWLVTISHSVLGS